MKRDWIAALKLLKQAAENGDKRAIDYLNNYGIEHGSESVLQSRPRITPDQPLAKNPGFDIALIPGQWRMQSAPSEIQMTIFFDDDGTYRSEGLSCESEAFHMSGRWAVAGDTLQFDVYESDIPIESDQDFDDTVISISATELVTRDSKGKVTTFQRVGEETANRKRTLAEKVIRLATRSRG